MVLRRPRVRRQWDTDANAFTNARANTHAGSNDQPPDSNTNTKPHLRADASPHTHTDHGANLKCPADTIANTNGCSERRANTHRGLNSSSYHERGPDPDAYADSWIADSHATRQQWKPIAIFILGRVGNTHANVNKN